MGNSEITRKHKKIFRGSFWKLKIVPSKKVYFFTENTKVKKSISLELKIVLGQRKFFTSKTHR